jgi:hypothetical protein
MDEPQYSPRNIRSSNTSPCIPDRSPAARSPDLLTLEASILSEADTILMSAQFDSPDALSHHIPDPQPTSNLFSVY